MNEGTQLHCIEESNFRESCKGSHSIQDHYTHVFSYSIFSWRFAKLLWSGRSRDYRPRANILLAWNEEYFCLCKRML